MITNIKIQNYKSILNMDLHLDSFNVIIGANGCGKSTILEAISMAGAASNNVLRREFMSNRGIRICNPKMMFPAFDDCFENLIKISVQSDNFKEMFFNISYNDKKNKIHEWEDYSEKLSDIKDIELKNKFKKDITQFFKNLESNLKKRKESNQLSFYSLELEKNDMKVKYNYDNHFFSEFLIYSLEESKLRNSDTSESTFPLGRKGEGLFPFLKSLVENDNQDVINEIKENLDVFDWFDDLEIPKNQMSNEYIINLTDKYLRDDLKTFDQRSANEGFLYYLFYLTLIISDKTPKFFAIENIDTAFNPKLCREVIKRLIELSKKHGKQIIATTHNPSVLDGLNLEDKHQNLISAFRDIDGATCINTIKPKGNPSIPLSQTWIKGFIGGLPNNF